MMKVLARYVGNNTLLVDTANPQTQFVPGRQYWLEVRVPTDRNAAHFRKWWAMLRYFRPFLERTVSDEGLASWAVAGASLQDANDKEYASWVIKEAGWFRVMPDGSKVAQSIAFGSMPQAEFQRLYDAALDYLLQVVGPDTMTRADVEAALRFA